MSADMSETADTPIPIEMPSLAVATAAHSACPTRQLKRDGDTHAVFLLGGEWVCVFCAKRFK